MESPVHTAAKSVEYTGKDVFAAVPLHVVKAVLPVDLHGNGIAGRKRTMVCLKFQTMIDEAVFFPDIGDRDRIDEAGITALSASGRKKYSLIGDQQPVAVAAGNLRNHSLTVFLVNIFLK